MYNEFIKEKMNGLTKEVHDWELLKTSSVFKPECKDISIEMSISYLKAAKVLYIAVQKESHPCNGISTLTENSLIIPFLYLCRHSIELALKVALNKKKIKYGNSHNLNELISKLDIIIDKKYQNLFDTLDLIDDKGMWLRYDKDLREGKEYINKPYFINSTRIIDTTKEIIKFFIGNEISI